MLDEPEQLALRYARGRLAPETDGFPADRLRRALADLLPPDRLDDALDRAAAADLAPPDELDTSTVVDALGDETRQSRGIYMTPPNIARGLAAAGRDLDVSVAVDPACGTGELLLAAAREAPDARLVGIEPEWPLAVVAATRLVARRREMSARQGGARIHVGDGLARREAWARWEGAADLVLLNPPYVGEKGNRALFDGIRDEHDHLREYVGPRCDLAYLFIHRALALLRAGGRLSVLSPAYWLSATGARGLRADLVDRTHPEAFVRIPSVRLFDDAPGHHSMVSLFRRRGDTRAPTAEQLALWDDDPNDGAGRSDDDCDDTVLGCTLEVPPDHWPELVADLLLRRRLPTDVDGELVHRDRDAFDDDNWTPFARMETAEWGRRLQEAGTTLGDLLEDRQGFVSGADRVSGRRLAQLDDVPDEVQKGDPLFVWETDELTDDMKSLRGLVVRPLLRGSDLEAGATRLEPPDTHVALYIDDELRDDQTDIVDHLEPLRPALEDRREVRRGTMPWYRLHWPRSRREQTQPKIVVPRRAEHPRFMLDLSASVVSSDCTYLLAPDSVKRPVRYLETMTRLLEEPFVERYLQHFGKRKGDLLEFYAEPLRSLPMPVDLRWGELIWNTPEVFGVDPGDYEFVARR
jgi:adenine-specific DNA-methyltransferase